MHFVTISTEVFFGSYAATLLPAMWAWLEADLKQAQANRTAEPWIVVNGHRPLCAPLSAPTRPLAACHA